MEDKVYLIFFYETTETLNCLQQIGTYVFYYYDELKNQMISAIKEGNYKNFKQSICNMEKVLICGIEKLSGLPTTTEMWNDIFRERVKRGYTTTLSGRFVPEMLFDCISPNTICYIKKV